MPQVRPVLVSRAVLVVLTCTVMVFVLSAANAHARDPLAAAPEPTAPSAKIVYLADVANPVIRSTVISSTQARSGGISVSATLHEFMTSAVTADALMVDNSRLNSLPTRWLATHYHNHKVIVGLNVASSQIEKVVEFAPTFQLAQFRQDWGGRPFFTLEYESPRGNSFRVGRASDVLRSPAQLVDRIQHTVPWAQGSVE